MLSGISDSSRKTPELVEVGDRVPAVDLLADAQRPLRLPVGLRQRRQRLGRAADAGAQQPADPAQPAR